MNAKNADLDDICSEIGGFGPFQMVTVSLFMLLNILTGATFMVFITPILFTSQVLAHAIFNLC